VIASTAFPVVQSGMAKRRLSVVTGALSRSLKPKSTQAAHDALAKRWRVSHPEAAQPPELPDIIPLMDAWIRRLEREAGTGTDPQISR
jgi:hypothetical protein